MLTEVIERVKTLARGKRQAVLTGYADAVRALARGQKADAEKVAELLDAAGKTAEEFEADVQAHAERVRLRAVADRQADAERKLATSKAKIESLERKLEEAVAAIREEAAPLHEQVRACERELSAAREAEDTLRKTYPADGPARVEYAEAQRRERLADAKRKELAGMVRMAEGTIAGATADPAHHSADTAPLGERRLAGYREELAQAEAERAAAVRDMEAATQRMTQP
jgi:DNA repair exonuclease SbcCD ATPase subunit